MYHTLLPVNFVHCVLLENLISNLLMLFKLYISNHYNLFSFDICGPSFTPAANGACYYIAFVDAYTRYVWFYLIHNKAQAFTVFKSFKLYAEKQTGFPFLSIQTVNAKEFLCFQSFLSTHGITH